MSVLAAVAALASCEKENQISGSKDVPGGQSETLGNTEIVASFEDTKASYAEEGTGLRPSWEVGDVVIAISDGKYAGETSKFTVKSVNPDGSANLQGNAHANCTLHLVYCPGAAQGTEIPVDYTAQTGAQKTMPAVMLSDGEVKDCKGEFKFRNAGAIVGISAVKGVPQNSKVTEITINGENLSAAKFTLDGSALKLTATTKSDDAITVDGLDLTVTDADGTLSTPVFVAVPAGAKIKKVSLPVTKEPETMKIPSTAAEKKDIDYVEIEAKYDGKTLSTKKWAKWNVGANSQTDYGWCFAWAGTEGYVWYADTWQLHDATYFEFSYTLTSVKTADASDYLYVKTQRFTPAGFSFVWVNTPYQTQNATTDYFSTKFTKYLGSTSTSFKDPSATDADALKTVLDPEDDAATVNWGGSWRMHTLAEFDALYDATTWTWDSTDNGYYVTKMGEALSADKSNALLFFPAAGMGHNVYLSDAGSFGYYWSSTLCWSRPSSACYFHFDSSGISRHNDHNRCYGLPVRPLSD